jgi:hypothetical protein
MQNYIVLAPAYDQQSAGIRVVHNLANELNRVGRTAYILFYRFPPTGGITFVSPGETSMGYCPEHTLIPKLPMATDIEEYRELINNAIVIYPEVMQLNPLGAPNVVRYILNSPNNNGYAIFHDPEDYIVAWSRNYWDKPDDLLTVLFDDPVFHDRDTLPAESRRMDLTYIGKGGEFGECFKMPGTVMLERRWPSDKESLAVLLRNTRYLLTWDLVSQTNLDALRCGAIPVVLRWHPFDPNVFQSEFGEIPYADIELIDGNAQVVYEPAIFNAKRAALLANYREVANSFSDRVRTFAERAEAYFSRPVGERRG